MKRLAIFLCFAFGIFIFSACSLYTVDFESTSYDFHPAKVSKDEVAYLETVSKPCDVIAHVTVNAERNQKMQEVLDKLKKEAAVLGGDAITNIQTNAGTGKWAKIKPKKLFGNANIRANYVADVVVFK